MTLIDTQSQIAIDDWKARALKAEAEASMLRKWKENIERSRHGLVALLFNDDSDVDELISWLMKRAERK